MLCLGVINASDPPQCSGPIVAGLEPVDWSHEAGGVFYGDRTVSISWPPIEDGVELISDSSPTRPDPIPDPPPGGEHFWSRADAEQAAEAIFDAGSYASTYGIDEFDRIEIEVAVADRAAVDAILAVVPDPAMVVITGRGVILE